MIRQYLRPGPAAQRAVSTLFPAKSYLANWAGRAAVITQIDTSKPRLRDGEHTT